MISRDRFKQGLKKAKRRTWWARHYKWHSLKEFNKFVARYRKTTAPCSCDCCGNRRRSAYSEHMGKTLQEYKFDLGMKYGSEG